MYFQIVYLFVNYSIMSVDCDFKVNQRVYAQDSFFKVLLVECVELCNNLLWIGLGYLLLILLGHIWLLVRVCDILTPLLLNNGLSVLRSGNLLLAPGCWLCWHRLRVLHSWRLHVDDRNQLIDNRIQIAGLWVPVLQVRNCYHVLLSDVVKFLYNVEG